MKINQFVTKLSYLHRFSIVFCIYLLSGSKLSVCKILTSNENVGQNEPTIFMKAHHNPLNVSKTRHLPFNDSLIDMLTLINSPQPPSPFFLNFTDSIVC